MENGSRTASPLSLRGITEAVLSLVFPPMCANCEAALEESELAPQLCRKCIGGTFTPKRPACQRCGLSGQRYDSENDHCNACRVRKLAFRRVVSLGEYEGSLQTAVVKMKSEGGQQLAYAVGRRLAELVSSADRIGQVDLLTCIPKYWLKRLATGVNSAETIMSGLGKQAKLYGARDLLVCERRIEKQSLLTPDQRRRNVRQAWSVTPEYDIRDKHVLLVDDIMTTGATAHEAAKALRSAGAREVSVAVIGRAATS